MQTRKWYTSKNCWVCLSTSLNLNYLTCLHFKKLTNGNTKDFYTLCIRNLHNRNLIWWFYFRLGPFFATASVASKILLHSKVFQKIIISLLLPSLSLKYLIRTTRYSFKMWLCFHNYPNCQKCVTSYTDEIIISL